MFTGIIEGLGKVEKFEKSTKTRSEAKMSITLGKLGRGLDVGDSVAINGVCLTAVKITKGVADFEMVGETISKTNLGSLQRGDRVNIERSLKVGERLEGHFVLGHVDGSGTISKIDKQRNQVKIWIRLPKDLARYVARKGSVTVDGISLTVVDKAREGFSVSIIPHTMKVTNLGMKKVGDKVNIETDVLAKYVLSENR
ncbi:MAG TPA: riboflavin synthase [Candidatus Nitrosotalea sp.]|nr:riboflavin synthase [Candidatus Nitrosotalea sp.]